MKREQDESTSERWSRKQFKRRKSEEADDMRDWKVDLDRHLTTEPERGVTCLGCEIKDGNNTHECPECIARTASDGAILVDDEVQHVGPGDCPKCGTELALMEDLDGEALCPYHSKEEAEGIQEDTEWNNWEDLD